MRLELPYFECDRCGKTSDQLLPFKAADRITYRRRVVLHPWLCGGCLRIENSKRAKEHHA